MGACSLVFPGQVRPMLWRSHSLPGRCTNAENAGAQDWIHDFICMTRGTAHDASVRTTGQARSALIEGRWYGATARWLHMLNFKGIIPLLFSHHERLPPKWASRTVSTRILPNRRRPTAPRGFSSVTPVTPGNRSGRPISQVSCQRSRFQDRTLAENSCPRRRCSDSRPPTNCRPNHLKSSDSSQDTISPRLYHSRLIPSDLHSYSEGTLLTTSLSSAPSCNCKRKQASHRLGNGSSAPPTPKTTSPNRRFGSSQSYLQAFPPPLRCLGAASTSGAAPLGLYPRASPSNGSGRIVFGSAN